MLVDRGGAEVLFSVFLRLSKHTAISRRGGRAVECTGLENQQGLVALRGFESHPLRQQTKKGPGGPIFGSARRVWLRMRALFDSRSGAAASENAEQLQVASGPLEGRGPVGRVIPPWSEFCVQS